VSEDANVKTVQSMYEAFGRGDIAYILDQLADDVVWENKAPRKIPWGGSYAGRDRVPAFFDAISSTVDTELFTPEEFIAQGDKVVVTGRFGAKVKSTGKSFTFDWVMIWTLKDQKVTSYIQFLDSEAALPAFSP